MCNLCNCENWAGAKSEVHCFTNRRVRGSTLLRFPWREYFVCQTSEAQPWCVFAPPWTVNTPFPWTEYFCVFYLYYRAYIWLWVIIRQSPCQRLNLACVFTPPWTVNTFCVCFLPFSGQNTCVCVCASLPGQWKLFVWVSTTFYPFPWNTFRVFYLYVRAYLFWGHNSVCYASALRGHLRTHRQKPKKGNQCDHVTFDLKVIARFTEFWQTNAMTINSSLCFKLKIPLFYLLKTRLKFATLVKWPKIDFHGCLGIEWVVFLSQNWTEKNTPAFKAISELLRQTSDQTGNVEMWCNKFKMFRTGHFIWENQ